MARPENEWDQYDITKIPEDEYLDIFTKTFQYYAMTPDRAPGFSKRARIILSSAQFRWLYRGTVVDIVHSVPNKRGVYVCQIPK